MSGAKGKTQYKKGQHLYKAGDKADRIFILQQGLVSVSMAGMKQTIDLYKATQPQLLGEEALRGEPLFRTTATAINDTSAIEIPVAEAKAIIDGSAAPLKLLATGILSKLSAMTGELASVKREAEAVPCPPERVAKMFTVIYQIALYTGKKKDDVTTVNWPAFKKYCQRIFLESPVRLEQAMYMLVNLKTAQLEMVKDETDPEAPEDLGFIHFRNLEEIGRFAKDPQGEEFDAYRAQLEHWNRNGQPEGMPVPEKPKKKAA